MPQEQGTPVVADKGRLLQFQAVQQPANIGHQLLNSIIFDPRGRVCTAVSPLIRRNCAVSGSGQCRQLVAPRKCQFGKAVQQYYRRPRTLLVHSQANAVRIDEIRVGKSVAHSFPLSC